MCWLQLAEGKMRLLGPPAFLCWLQLAGGKIEVCFRLEEGKYSSLQNELSLPVFRRQFCPALVWLIVFQCPQWSGKGAVVLLPVP